MAFTMLICNVDEVKLNEQRTKYQQPGDLTAKAAPTFAAVLTELFFAMPALGMTALPGENAKPAEIDTTGLHGQFSGQLAAFQGIVIGTQLQESLVAWPAGSIAFSNKKGGAGAELPLEDGPWLPQEGGYSALPSKVVAGAEGDLGVESNLAQPSGYIRYQWPAEVREPAAPATQPGSIPATGGVPEKGMVPDLADKHKEGFLEEHEVLAREVGHAAKEVAHAVRPPDKAYREMSVQAAGKTLQLVAPAHQPQQKGYAAEGVITGAGPPREAPAELLFKAALGTLGEGIAAPLTSSRAVGQGEVSLLHRAAFGLGMPRESMFVNQNKQTSESTPTPTGPTEHSNWLATKLGPTDKIFTSMEAVATLRTGTSAETGQGTWGELFDRLGNADSLLKNRLFPGVAQNSHFATAIPISMLEEGASYPTHIFLVEAVARVIKEAVVFRRAEGETTIRLKLSPAHLGELTVRILHKEGAVAVEIYTTSKAAGEIINAGMPYLQEQLAQHHLRLESFTVLVSQGNLAWFESSTGEHYGEEAKPFRLSAKVLRLEEKTEALEVRAAETLVDRLV